MCKESNQIMANETSSTSQHNSKPQNDDDDDVNTSSNSNNNNNNENENNKKDEINNNEKSICTKLIDFYWENEFLIVVVIVILLARAYPPIGATYLIPDITATWIAVIFIFIMAGLSLKTKEFTNALMNVYFNIFVQIYNFGFVSSIVYGISRGLVTSNILNTDLADGLVICSSLPMTINMVLVLTKSSGGNEASAIFNAAFGNMIGVFLSPILILGYLGVSSDIDLFNVFYKLLLRVVVPVIFGQLLQKFVPAVVKFVNDNKSYFKQAQQYCLVFIVYTVFCKTFEDGSSSNLGDVFIMIAFQLILLTSFMVIAWILLKLLFPNQPTLRVMGLYGCTHKTVAMGVPLINAIYENNTSIGLYTLPLLIWHPMQLVLGTFLSPKLSKWVDNEKLRLGINDENNNNNNNGNNVNNDDNLTTEENNNLVEATEEGRLHTDSNTNNNKKEEEESR